MNFVDWVLIVTGVIMGSLGGVFLKTGAVEINYANGAGHSILQILFNWRIITGVILYFIPFGIWIVLLKKLDITFLQPILSLTYVVTPFLGIIFLRENVSILRWIGIIIILLGVAIVSQTKGAQ